DRVDDQTGSRHQGPGHDPARSRRADGPAGLAGGHAAAGLAAARALRLRGQPVRASLVIGVSQSHRTASPPKANPDMSGMSGGSVCMSTPEYCEPSGNVSGSWYHLAVWPWPSQVTECHGYCASHTSSSAASRGSPRVDTASSILAYAPGWSIHCSTVGIRWQLIPTVDSTVNTRSPCGGRSVMPTVGSRSPLASQ